MGELGECIKDGLEDSMKSYIKDTAYEKHQNSINNRIQKFRSNLCSEQQIQEFNSLIDIITAQHAEFASEAYLRGTVEGIALRNKILGTNQDI